MNRVLFFYATRSCGHQKAAEAIQKSLLQLSPGIQTSGIDFFTYHYPNIGPLFSKLYLELLRYIPHNTWDHIYDSPDVVSFTTELRQLFTLINAPKLHEDIDRFKPDIIVCTQAVPAGFIASEKQKEKLSLPMYAVLTDFVANPYWPDSNVDCYFVPDMEVKDMLTERGIGRGLIKITGIPIDDSFGRNIRKKTARKILGLSASTPTLLLMGGSLGIGDIPQALDILTSSDMLLQIIVVTGQNVSLYKALREKYSLNTKLLILKHTTNISCLMDASDILVSKPGGLTSSEALAKKLPMIILSPLPGQEERNTSYLLRHGVAERCNDIAILPQIVKSFLHSPYKTRSYRTRASGIARPGASFDIASHIVQALEEQNRSRLVPVK